MKERKITNTILDLEWTICAKLRYSQNPKLGLETWSTRNDVRRVRHLIPDVDGIGRARLAEIDRWLGEQQ